MVQLDMIEELRGLIDITTARSDGLVDPRSRPGEPSWIRAKLDIAVAAHDGRHDESLEFLDRVISEAEARNALFWSTTARIDAARSAAALALEPRVDELLSGAEIGARSMGASLLLDRIAELRDDGAAATGS